MEAETEVEEKCFTIYYEGYIDVIADNEDDAYDRVYSNFVDANIGMFKLTACEP